MQDTSIAWADISWNPIRGCSRISPGCQHCYAEQDMARKNTNPKVPGCHGFAEFRIIGDRREAHWTGKVELIESKLMEPLSWRRKAAKFRAEHGRKPRAFISMSDLFHESLPDEAIDRVFAVAALTPEINYMFLTKRAARMAEYSNGYIGERIDAAASDLIDQEGGDNLCAEDFKEYEFPLSNVALGVSVESQKYADERIPHLLRTPAAMRFVSYEPALEAVDWDLPRCDCHDRDELATDDDGFDFCMECAADGRSGELSYGHWLDPLNGGLNMIIVGGESGPGARQFNIAWARSTVEQCRAAGVAPFVKQMGSKPIETSACVECSGTGKDCEICYGAGEVGLPFITSDRKGENMSEWPEDLRVREWPEGWN